MDSYEISIINELIQKSIYQMTPLHSAEKYWKKDIVEFLIMHIDKLKTIKMRKNEAIYYEKK